MSQFIFSVEWLSQFTDPYAVLGASVTADERRILKRYRSVAKLLHPDSFPNAPTADRDRASQLFAHLVNPAYQRLKLDQGRAEALATLRLWVRGMNWEEPLAPQSKLAQQMVRLPLEKLDVFYEQAVTQLADIQYQSFAKFEGCTRSLAELNLIYLHLKTREPVIREKRSGLVSAKEVQPRPTPLPAAEPQRSPINYAQRHFQRAQEYIHKKNWALAARELQDALRIDNTRSDYHALLGKAYLMQDLPIMAKVHFRQALKLNPQEPIALAYVKKLQIKLDPAPAPNSSQPRESKPARKLFGLFSRKGG